MIEEESGHSKLIDTTDCLEAIGVFRGWKNFLFVVVLLILIALQACFWLVNLGLVKISTQSETRIAIIPAEPEKSITPTDPEKVVTPTEPVKTVTDVNNTEAVDATEAKTEIAIAAKKITAEPNKPIAVDEPTSQKADLRFEPTFEQLSWLIKVLNFALIPAAILYCLTMLFSLKVSMLGRLGGINHISRAFFLSLVFVVLLMPWQRLFSGVIVGAIYTPEELLNSCTADDADIFSRAFCYLRFTGYWLLVILLLIFAHLRSSRWTKTILRRLEVI